MFQQDALADAQFWRQRAAWLVLRLNFHHWLSRLVPKLFGLMILMALGELFRRETGRPARWIEAFFVFAVALLGAWAWLEARRHFCTWTQALVRLETILGLHNQLSSACEGIVPWPTARHTVEDGYHANWKQILLPLLAGFLFLGAAHLIPVSRVKAGQSAEAISAPPDFVQVQNWIDALQTADMIEPEKLQDMQSAIDKLRQQPAQNWYTQSNLEAADSLKELTEQSMNSLAQDLDQADQAVEAMRDKEATTSSASSLRAMQDKLSQAGDNLASGNLPLKKEFVDQMKGGIPNDKPLSAAQLAALHQRLKKGESAARTAPKSNGAFGEEMQQAMANAARGRGAGRRELMPGAGGLGGGEESAPLALQARDKETPEGALTPVKSDDMSRAALGETVKVTASKPNVDTATYRGTQAAGAAQVEGNGGEAVWRSTYDPQEADTLSRFFK
jgi:hypothetical protein